MRQGLKLTQEQVDEIKLALAKPYRGQQKALAEKYNVSRNIIGEISRGTIYKD